MKNLAMLFSVMLLIACSHVNPKVSNGRIVHLDKFPTHYVDPRNVDIWLPDGYSTGNRYPVLYMNDGQMLYDSTITWNKQEWKVDEVITRLVSENKIRPCIVVGIWNNGKFRFPEYFPQRPLDYISADRRDTITKKYLEGEALSDRYLQFLVKELKPYIDLNYSTIADSTGTYIMGSSMGGLISIYAICEYPGVFGGAGCMSTHWPMVDPKDSNNTTQGDIEIAFRDYLVRKLPSPEHHKIYYDFGTETLDALYEPHQKLIDSLMKLKGFDSTNWITMKFPGENHSERSWSKRLNIPLEFFLASH